MACNCAGDIARKVGLITTAFVVMLVCATVSFAQVFVTIQNNHISASVGVSGQLNSTDVAGRFAVAEVGSSTNTLMNSVVSATEQSYVTLRIDGGTQATPASGIQPPGWDLIFGDTGTTTFAASGEWIEPPTIIPGENHIVAKWHTLPVVVNKLTTPVIEVDLNMYLVHDMVVYKFTIINEDTVVHTIGLRFCQDYQGPNGVPDGPVLTDTQAPINVETDLRTPPMPSYYRVVDPNTNDSVGATLAPPSSGSIIPTVPNEVGFAAPTKFANGQGVTPSVLWSFTPDPTNNFSSAGGNAEAALYYYPTLYLPTQSNTITATFGRQHGVYNFDDPYAVCLDAPDAIKYTPDPTQATLAAQLSPNPITVYTYVQNTMATALNNVTASLNLPSGLTLLSGQNATQSITTIAPYSEGVFSWQAQADGSSSGSKTILVSIADSTFGVGKSLSKSIDIPALPVQTFPGTLQMVSFPYNFTDPTPSTATGLPSITHFLQWNENIGAYQSAQTLQPGQGYFLNLPSQTTVNLQGASPLPTTTTSYSLKLNQGWNIIGNPFLYPILWSEVQVLYNNPNSPGASFTPLPVQTASDLQHNWIDSTLYWFDTSAQDYRYDQDFNTPMEPFVGYWVKSNEPNVTLIFTTPTDNLLVPPTNTTTTTTTSKMVSTNWNLQLVAKAANSSDAWNFIGVSPNGSDNYNTSDIAKPPSIGNVSLAIVHKDWGSRNGLYAQDIRSTSVTQKQWNIQFTSKTPNTQVTLSWPNIQSLPRANEMILEDPSTNQRWVMNQTSSVTLSSGPTGIRSLTVLAEPRMAAGAFRFTSWNIVPSRGNTAATISVSATQNAQISIKVLSASGQTIRDLGSEPMTSRSVQIGWDYKDSSGKAVPSGAYLVQITGVTPDGQSARVVIPHLIIR